MNYNLKKEGNFIIIYKQGEVVFNYPAKDLTYVIIDDKVVRFILLNICDETSIKNQGEVDYNIVNLLNDNTPFSNINEFKEFLNDNLGFKNGGRLGNGIIISQNVNTFNDLIDGTKLGELSYVSESQGTLWNPASNGGSYYPSGWYIWNGTTWVSDRNAIANQLEQLIIDFSQKADVNHTHVKADITDFNDSDYATANQGNKADSAIQVETDPVFLASEASNFVAGDKIKLDNISTNNSGTNTGDETTNTIKTKRPLKTIEGFSLEGIGNIDLSTNNIQVSVKNISLGESYATNLRDVFLDDGATYFPNSSGNSKAKELQTGLLPTIAFYPSAVKAGVLYNNSKDRLKDFTAARSTTATYVDEDGIIQTAAIGVARLDYSEGGCPKLLIENASTNLILNSEPTTFEGSSGDITYESYEWANGLSNAVVFPSTTSDAYRYAGTVVEGNTYTLSVYVQMEDLSVPIPTLSGDFLFIIGGEAVTTYDVKDFGNGVFRVSGTRVAGSSLASSGVIKYASQSSKSFKVTGLQLEEANFASSYIPTSGVIATRGKDTLNLTNIGSLLGNNATLFIEGNSNGGGSVLFYNDVNTLLARLYLGLKDGSLRVRLENPVSTTSRTQVLGSQKLALKHSNGIYTLFINGEKIEGIAEQVVFGINKIGISGSVLTQGGQTTINKIQVYNRALSDEELIDLTK